MIHKLSGLLKAAWKTDLPLPLTCFVSSLSGPICEIYQHSKHTEQPHENHYAIIFHGFTKGRDTALDDLKANTIEF